MIGGWKELGRLRGGAKTKRVKPRSWKDQGEHHRFKRKASIRNNRGQRKAMYTAESLKVLQKDMDRRRLKELEDKEIQVEVDAEEQATGVEHQMRLEYMKINEEEDARREAKYQTLEDYSDSVERELEELRQKRGDTIGLTVPDWREGHPSYWKEVDKRTREEDLEDSEKVLDDCDKKGDVWKVAAYNRKKMEKANTAPTNQLLIEAAGGLGGADGGGGGGGQLIAHAQSQAPAGPEIFEEAPSSYIEEEEEKEEKEAKAKVDARTAKKDERRNALLERRRRVQMEEEEEEGAGRYEFA